MRKIIALALALTLALFAFTPPQVFSQEGGEYQQVESGRFVLQQKGERVGEESFALSQLLDGRFKLSSDITLSVLGMSIEMRQECLLSPQLQPISYSLDIDTPTEKQKVGANILDGEARLFAEARGQAYEKMVVSEQDLVILDNNIISQYLILYRLVRGEGVGSFTALIPQALLSLPLKVEKTGKVALKSEGKKFEAERYLVLLGDLNVEMYSWDGKVIGVSTPAQSFFSYRGDILPEGFEIVKAAEEEAIGPPRGVKEIEVSFNSDGLNLVGTLALPENAIGPVTGVVLIAGSGPVDRDENVPGVKMDFFKVLAYRLAQGGIASLRYDKRGVGESEGEFNKASFMDLVNDARSAVVFLKGREEIDPKNMFILGHSEGGYIAPILATEGGVKGLITVAGPAHSLDWIILKQLELAGKEKGLTEEQIKEGLEEQRDFTEFVKSSHGDWENYTFEEVKSSLPWLEPITFEAWKQGLSLRWFREHFTRDPLETIGKVKVPVLIVQGGKDAQVPRGEAYLLATELWKAGNRQVTICVIPDLNHLMRYHPEEPNLTYRHLDEPVDERVLNTITRWVIFVSDSWKARGLEALSEVLRR